MSKVTILTSPSCSYCHAAKRLLRQQGVEYREIDLIEGGEQAQELLRQSEQRTVPQIFINDKPLGGYSELSELIANNKFDLTRNISI